MAASKEILKPQAAKPDTFQQREDLLKKQFAESRRGLQAEKNRALQENKQNINRFAAANQMQGSGRLLKLQGKQAADISQRIGEAEAGISAQEAAAQQALLGEKGQQEFAAGEAEKQRELAREQFNKQFGEMTRQWNLEFSENLKTNLINAAIALRDADLGNADEWANLIREGGPLEGIYGAGRKPQIRSDLAAIRGYGGGGQQQNAPRQGGTPGFYNPIR